MKSHPSYEIFEELGRGEDSVVMRGYDLNLGREVAIKQMEGAGEVDDRRRQRFLKEASFLAQFEHENILRIYSVEPQQGWIVMEMMKGTLASLIAKRPMPADMVRSVIQQVLTALDFLHNKNKVHGAVRPSNLLINEHGTVKLSDFEESSSDGELRAPTGSKKYLAPELIRSEFGEFGPTVDLYCLGFTALELLLGKKFNAQFPGTGKGAIDEDVAWLRWHSSDESLKSVKQLVPSCPDDLANVIDAMLNKSAADRPQSAGEVLKQLQDKPLVAVPVPDEQGTESNDVATTSMLPGDAQLREWSPLNQAKKNADQGKGKEKRKRRAAAPVATKSSVNEFLEKPYVLWPLCALILLGALLVGWKLKQSKKKDIADVNPVEQIKDEDATKKPVIDTSVGVRLNILPDDSNVIIQVDGGSVEQQKEGLYRLESGMRKLTVQKSDFETYEAILSISKEQNEFDIELVRLADPTPPEPIVSTEKKKTLPVIDKPKTDPVEVVRSKVAPPKPTRKEIVEPIDHEAIARKMEKLKDESGLYEVSAALISDPGAVVDAPANEAVERLAAQFKGNAELIIDSGGFMSEISDLSFSPDGKLLAAGGEKCVRIWDMDSGQLVTTLRGDRSRTSYGGVGAVAFSPDGSELLVGIGDYAKHGSIRIYDTSDFSEIKQLLPGHTAPCSQICFSRDGQNMASVDSDGTILLWDWKRRSIVERVAPRNEKNSVFDGLFFPTDKPYVLGIDFDGPHIMSATTGQRLGAQDEMPNEVRGWLVDIFNKLVKFPFNTKKQPRVFDFRMERSIWATAGVGREGGSNKFWVGIWESRGPQTTPNPATKLGQYSKHRWNVSTVEIGPRDNLVASGDKFGEVHVWNYKTGKRLFKFSGQGKPIYEVAFEQGSSRIAFGTRAFSPKEWKHNNHGRANKVLDLARRAILNADSIEGLRLSNEQPSRNGAKVSVARTKTDNHFTVRFDSSESQTEYRISSGRNPTVYTLLDRATLGVTRPVVFGDNEGLLALWDSSGDELKRAFIGHDSLVSGISPSFNGKLLASGATDRTIRIWSLENYRPTGIFDFKFEDSTVREVIPGTSSANAGVQVGDKIESIDGKTLREMFDLMLEGKFDYRPGQTIPVVMRRGSAYSYDMTLTDGYDFVDPLLNVFIGDDDHWIIWSPQGYYDASPGADELIGWHVNRGPDKSARFYKVQQFQEQLYRPDIIDRILETGSLQRALNDSKTVKRNRSEEDSIDLRDTREFAKSIPPVVRIQEPVRGSVRKEATLPVKCDVKSVNGLPIKEVTLLHNGSVAKVFRPRQNNSRQMSIEHNLKLVPGQNQVAVVAANARSKSANEEVQVVYQTREPRSLGDAYVLSVGVSKFADKGSDLKPLVSAGSDAQAIVKMLKASAGGKLYDKVHTRLLTNEQASRGDILDGFQWLVDNVKDGDTVMVFLSTHALVDSRDNFYLASYDAKAGRARSSAVSWRDLTDTLHFDLPDCKRMLLLDLRATKSAIKKGLRSPLLDLASPEQGTTFLSSNTLQELAEAKANNEKSAFVQAILRTVRDQRFDVVPDAGDSLLNPVEFASGVTSYVQEMTDDNQHPVFYAPMAARRINVLELQK